MPSAPRVELSFATVDASIHKVSTMNLKWLTPEWLKRAEEKYGPEPSCFTGPSAPMPEPINAAELVDLLKNYPEARITVNLPCAHCGSAQIEVCIDANNPMKDLVRCRECKMQGPRESWNRRA